MKLINGGHTRVFVFHDFGEHMGWLYMPDTIPFRWYSDNPEQARLIVRQRIHVGIEGDIFTLIKPGTILEVHVGITGNPSDYHSGKTVLALRDLEIRRRWITGLGAMSPDEIRAAEQWLELSSRDYLCAF